MMTKGLQRELFRALLLLGLVLLPMVGHSQAFRAYLSGKGADGNDCGVNTPCRTLGRAMQVVQDGGEIWMLDSANFGAGQVTIDKSVKVLAIPGAQGSIAANAAVNGPDALVINAPGKDVTLRNLMILNLANGINGVNIQDAGAVHIEKTTITDFSDATGNCVLLQASTTVRVYVDDVILRHCHNAIHANGTANLANRSSVIIDGTRIERGFINAAGQAVGVLQQGCVDVSIRNTVISRQDVGIQGDSLTSGCANHLQLVQTELTRNTTGLNIQNAGGGAQVNAQLEVSIDSSQIVDGGDAIIVNNSANTTLVALNISNSSIMYCGNNCVTLTDTASDTVRGIQVNMFHSQIASTPNTALSMNVPNGSRIRVWIRDSTMAGASDRLIKTAGGGASVLTVSLIRSNLNNSGYLLDHGFGQVRLDGCHMTHFTETFVNNGSGDVRSLGNNWLSNFQNASGFTYITPTIISPI